MNAACNYTLPILHNGARRGRGTASAWRQPLCYIATEHMLSQSHIKPDKSNAGADISAAASDLAMRAVAETPSSCHRTAAAVQLSCGHKHPPHVASTGSSMAAVLLTSVVSLSAQYRMHHSQNSVPC